MPPQADCTMLNTPTQAACVHDHLLPVPPQHQNEPSIIVLKLTPVPDSHGVPKPAHRVFLEIPRRTGRTCSIACCTTGHKPCPRTSALSQQWPAANNKSFPALIRRPDFGPCSFTAAHQHEKTRAASMLNQNMAPEHCRIQAQDCASGCFCALNQQHGSRVSPGLPKPF
jgi:hypothetical protein